MKTLAIITSVVLVCAAYVACAQGQWGSSAQAPTVQFYGCPGHPGILAMWPALSTVEQAYGLPV